MTQQDALYRAVCAHPGDDTPRLVFADWLEEAGDARQAHFIRTQIELARVPEHDPLWAQCRRSDPNAVRGWAMAHTLPVLPHGVSWRRFRFHRGFPCLAAIDSMDRLLNGGRRIFESAPLQSLDFESSCGIVKSMEAFVEWPDLTRLTRLQFSHTRLRPAEMRRLGHSSFAVNLSEISFEGHAIEADGLAALVESPLFLRLRRLELNRAALSPSFTLDAFGDAKSNLKSFSISDCKFSAPDAAHLLGLPFMQGLQSLDLSCNPLGPEFLQSLSTSSVLGTLEMLDVSGTMPGSAGIRALAGSGSLVNLRRLNLSENRLGPTAIRFLSEAQNLQELRMLDLSRNPIDGAGVRALAECRNLPDLVELDVRGCSLSRAEIGTLEERFGPDAVRSDQPTNVPSSRMSE